MNRPDFQDLGFFPHPDAEPVTEDLDGSREVWVDPERKEVDALGVPFEGATDSSGIVEPVTERFEVSGIEDACELAEVVVGEVHDATSSIQTP